MSVMDTELAFTWRRSKANAIKQHTEFARLLTDAEKMDGFGGALTAMVEAFSRDVQAAELLDSYGYGPIDLDREHGPGQQHISFSIHSNMRDALHWREFGSEQKQRDLILAVNVQHKPLATPPQRPSYHPCNLFTTIIRNRFNKLHNAPITLTLSFIAQLYELGFRLDDFWRGVVEMREVLNMDLVLNGFHVSLVFDLNTMEESHTLLEMMVVQQEAEGAKPQ